MKTRKTTLFTAIAATLLAAGSCAPQGQSRAATQNDGAPMVRLAAADAGVALPRLAPRAESDSYIARTRRDLARMQAEVNDLMSEHADPEVMAAAEALQLAIAGTRVDAYALGLSPQATQDRVQDALSERVDELQRRHSALMEDIGSRHEVS